MKKPFIRNKPFAGNIAKYYLDKAKTPSYDGVNAEFKSLNADVLLQSRQRQMFFDVSGKTSTLRNVLDFLATENKDRPSNESTTQNQLIPAEYSYANFQQTLFAFVQQKLKDSEYVLVDKNEVTDQHQASEKTKQCSVM